MTNLRDMLLDFQADTVRLYETKGQQEITQENMENYEEAIETLINDFIDTVKERLIG